MVENKSTDPSYDDTEVMDGATRTVKLGSIEHTFCEPKAGAAGAFRRKFAKTVQGWDKAVESEDVDLALDVTDHIMGLIFEFDPSLQDRRDEILESATEREIMEALMACRELVDDPLVSFAQNLAAKATAQTRARAQTNHMRKAVGSKS